MSATDDGTAVRRALVFVVLVVLTVCAFLPTLGNGFIVDFDDGTNLRDNLSFRGLGLAQIAWAWRTMLLGVYQPLAWMELSAEYVAWGLKPWGYHLVSIVWHAANACLVFLLIDHLIAVARPELDPGDRALGAALGAGMFAVHPLRVEVVAWASCQPYLPSAFFALGALLVYLRAQTKGPRRPLLVLSWLLLLTALLHKAIAILLPVVFLIVDAYPLRRFTQGSWRQAVLEKLPFLVLSVAFGVVGTIARDAAEVTVDRRAPSARFAQAGDAVAYYLAKSVAPVRLTPFHPLPTRASIMEPWYLAEVGAMAALSVALVAMRRRWPAALAAWAAYLVLVGPNSGFVRIGMMGNADRYSYLSTIGFFVLAGGAVASLRALAQPRPIAVAAVGAALLSVGVLGILTWRQCAVWRDSGSFHAQAAAVFAEVVRSHPDLAAAHIDLGAVLVRCRRFDEAQREFQAAVRLSPGLADAHAALGQALAEHGQTAEALAELSEAVRLDPSAADFLVSRAGVLARQGRNAEAEADYRAAQQLEPANPYWHAGLGMILFRQGRLADAEAELVKAARLRPENPMIHSSLERVRHARAAR